MAAEQTEPLDCDSYSIDFPTAEAENDGRLLGSTEVGPVGSTECVGVASTGQIMQSDTIISTDVVLSQSGNKKDPGDTGGVVISDSISAVGDGDSRAAGSVSINTMAVLDKCRFSEGNPIALDLSNPNDVQLVADQQSSGTVTSNKVEVFDCAIPKDNSRITPTEKHNSYLLPRGLKAEDKVTIGAYEDSKNVVTAPGSGVHANLTLTFTSALTSNQSKGFEVASTIKSKNGKAVDTTLQGLEDNQVAEDAYDMDFDVFPEEHCMFTPLDAGKTEPWHAIVVGDVIMEKSTGVLHNNQYSKVGEREHLPEEANNKPGSVHEFKENNAVRNVDRVYDTERESFIKNVQTNSRSMEERSAFSDAYIQANEEKSGVGHEVDVATLSSDAIEDNDLACKCSQIENVSDIQGQCFTDDGFKSLEDMNVDCTNTAGSCETKRLEDEGNSGSKMESESSTVNTAPGDAAAMDQELDHGIRRGHSVYDIAAADFNAVSEVAEHSQIEAGGNVIGQDSEHLDFAKKDKFSPEKYSVSSSMDQCIDQTHASTSPIQCSGALCTEKSLDAEHHMDAGDHLGAARLGSCTGEEGSHTQVDIQGKDTCKVTDNWHFAKTDDSVDQSGGSKAIDHLINNSETASLSHCPGAYHANSSALAVSDVIEPERLSKVLEEKESVSSADCRGLLLETVSGRATKYETSTLNQNAMHEELALHNSDIQDTDDVLSGTLRMKPLPENQGNEPVVINVVPNPTAMHDIFGFVVERTDVEEISDSGNERTEVIKTTQNEAKASSMETPQDELIMCAGHKYDGTRESIHSKLNHVRVQVDEAVEDMALEATVESNKKACGIASNKEFDGGSVCVLRKDGDESFDMRKAITDSKAVTKEQETDALNEVPEDHYLMQASCTLSPDLNSVADARNQELPGVLSFHLPSLPDFESVVRYKSELAERVGIVDGLKDTKNLAALEKKAIPVGRTRARRRAYAHVPVKKQSKRLKTGDNNPKPEVLHKVGLISVEEAHKGIREEDCIIAKSYSEQTNDSSLEKIPKAINEELDFHNGEMVWAKVKSHPWWPGLIFDPADASKFARKTKKDGRVLVAFFGDCTFAWVQQSQMIPFRPNFEEKVQQNTVRILYRAVEEALEELCRRSELGLSCEHFKGSLRPTSLFPDSNTGIRGGVNVERLRGICTSAEMFRPEKTLDFVKSIAASPLGEWSSTPQWAESRGYAYGLRTCMVAMQDSGSVSVASMPPAEISQILKFKRSHSSLEQAIPDAAVSGKESKNWKKLKSCKDRKESEGKGVLAAVVSREQSKQVLSGCTTRMKSDMRNLPEIRGGNKPKNIIQVKLNKLSKLGRSDTRSATAMKGVLKKIGEESQKNTITHQAFKAKTKAGSSDMGGQALVTIETDIDDPFSVPRSPSLSDGIKKLEAPKISEIGLKREAPIMDKAGKTESVRKFSKVGDSIRRVASELKGTPVGKCMGGLRPEGLEVKKVLKEPSVAFQTSTVHRKGFSNESPEDVSLLQLRRDLELLSKKAGMQRRSSSKKYAL